MTNEKPYQPAPKPNTNTDQTDEQKNADRAARRQTEQDRPQDKR